MLENNIHTLDLNFMGVPGTIACYLIKHQSGGVLVECGPGSTLEALQATLKSHGFSISDITDVLLTHIHLDHAGAAGWLAQQGARIHVHPRGAPHLINPEKLLASATRIYGESMQSLWGEFLPVPEERLSIIEDGDTIELDSLSFRAIDTPGHANHHFVYLFDDVCFSGDIGGVRLVGLRYLNLPMPPPEFHIEKWRASLLRLRHENFDRIAPTHFGIYNDSDWHLTALKKALDEVENWINVTLPGDPSLDVINEHFQEWSRMQSLSAGLDSDQRNAYEVANPTWISSYGIQRYWRKYCANKQPQEAE